MLSVKVATMPVKVVVLNEGDVDSAEGEERGVTVAEMPAEAGKRLSVVARWTVAVTGPEVEKAREVEMEKEPSALAEMVPGVVRPSLQAMVAV